MQTNEFDVLLQNIFELLKGEDDDVVLRDNEEQHHISNFEPLIQNLLQNKGFLSSRGIIEGLRSDLLFGGDPSAALVLMGEGIVAAAAKEASLAYTTYLSNTATSPEALFDTAIRSLEAKVTAACQILFWRLGVPNPLSKGIFATFVEDIATVLGEPSNNIAADKVPIASPNVREAAISLMWACSKIAEDDGQSRENREDEDDAEQVTSMTQNDEDEAKDTQPASNATSDVRVPLALTKCFQCIAVCLMCRHMLWAMVANTLRRSKASSSPSVPANLIGHARATLIKSFLPDLLQALTTLVIPTFVSAASQCRASSGDPRLEALEKGIDMLFGNDYEPPLVSAPVMNGQLESPSPPAITHSVPAPQTSHPGPASWLYNQHVLPLLGDVVWIVQYGPPTSASVDSKKDEEKIATATITAIVDVVAYVLFTVRYGSYNANTNGNGNIEHISRILGKSSGEVTEYSLSESILIKCLKDERDAKYKAAMARYQKAIEAGRQIPKPDIGPLGSYDEGNHPRPLWVSPLLMELASLLTLVLHSTRHSETSTIALSDPRQAAVSNEVRALIFTEALNINQFGASLEGERSSQNNMSVEDIKAWWAINTTPQNKLLDLIDPAYARTIPIEQKMERIHSRKEHLKAVMVLSDDEDEAENDSARLAHMWESQESAAVRAVENRLLSKLFGKDQSGTTRGLINEIMGVQGPQKVLFPPIAVAFLLHQILEEDLATSTAKTKSPPILSLLFSFAPIAVGCMRLTPPRPEDAEAASAPKPHTEHFVATLSTLALVLTLLHKLLVNYHNNGGGSSNKFTVDFPEEQMHEEEQRGENLAAKATNKESSLSFGNTSHEVRSSHTYQAFAHLTQCLLHLTRSCPSAEHRALAKVVLELLLDTFVLSVRRKLLSALFALAPTSQIAEASLTLIKSEVSADKERIAAGTSSTGIPISIERFLTPSLALEMLSSLRLRVTKEVKLLRMFEWVEAITATTQFIRLTLIQEIREVNRAAPQTSSASSIGSFNLLTPFDIRQLMKVKKEHSIEGKLVVRSSVLSLAKSQLTLGKPAPKKATSEGDNTNEVTKDTTATAEYVAACLLEWVLKPLQGVVQSLSKTEDGNTSTIASVSGANPVAPAALFGFECAVDGINGLIHIV